MKTLTLKFNCENFDLMRKKTFFELQFKTFFENNEIVRDGETFKNIKIYINSNILFNQKNYVINWGKNQNHIGLPVGELIIDIPGERDKILFFSLCRLMKIIYIQHYDEIIYPIDKKSSDYNHKPMNNKYHPFIEFQTDRNPFPFFFENRKYINRCPDSKFFLTDYFISKSVISK